MLGREVKTTVALAGALVLTLSLATPAFAQDSERCSDLGRGEPSFACETVMVGLAPGYSDIEPVIAACQPEAVVMQQAPERSAADDTLGFQLRVPRGSEIDLRDCYRLQVGVASAELGYFGQLLETAVPRAGHPAWLVGAIAVASVGWIVLAVPRLLRRYAP